MAKQIKFQFVLSFTYISIALLILLDLAIPGKRISETILNVQSELQQHYNASGNYHYSYKVLTENHQFSVSKDLAQVDWQGRILNFSVSRIFGEVNWYRMTSKATKSYHPLRILSGLVVPLLMLITLFIRYRSKKKLDILLFILQFLFIANLIYLIR